jgi:26S proteasome regulatory subunit N1
MTAVPKPLKFLRPHYHPFEKTFESWPAGDNKNALAEVLSVLGMTYSDEAKLDSLKYRLLAPSTDIGSWGHEYIRHLALEIGHEYQNRLNDDKDYADLVALTETIVRFCTKHNSEADAVDMLSELEMIEDMPKYLDKDTFERTCLYMIRYVRRRAEALSDG